MNISTNLIEATMMVLIFNIPFGYWRYNVRKLSFQWFLAVHIPVPFIILMRFGMNIGFYWITYIFLMAAFFLGQLLGGKIHQLRKDSKIVSSCLVMDLYRNLINH